MCNLLGKRISVGKKLHQVFIGIPQHLYYAVCLSVRIPFRSVDSRQEPFGKPTKFLQVLPQNISCVLLFQLRIAFLQPPAHSGLVLRVCRMLDDLLRIGFRQHSAAQQPFENMIWLQAGFYCFVQSGQYICFLHIPVLKQIIPDLLRRDAQTVLKQFTE